MPRIERFRCGSRSVVIAAVVAGSLLFAGPASSAAPVWSIAPSPPTRGTLSGVTCPGVNSCFAVGSRIVGPADQPVEKTLVEHWNGNGWSIMTSPTPPGAADVDLAGVSCPSTTSCFAVGDFAAATLIRSTLVEHWDGTGWAIMTSADPPRHNTIGPVLNAVSCPATNSCFAVGATVEQRNLVEHWNGNAWTFMTMPPSTRNFQTPLLDVSCASRKLCIAVGDDAYGTFSGTFVELWNGISWESKRVPSVPVNSGLSGVSCPFTDSCFAVGHSVDSSGRSLTLVERWNGKYWAVMRSPNPIRPANVDSGLAKVTCTNQTYCLAVGGVGQTLVERWVHGSPWAIMSGARPPATSALRGVSCGTTIGCLAVGTERSPNGPATTLIEQFRLGHTGVEVRTRGEARDRALRPIGDCGHSCDPGRGHKGYR